MESKQATEALAALAHETRLAVFRLLMREGPDGLPAGTVGERAGIAPSTLSFHLGHLERAGLLRSWRVQRQIFYAVDVTGTRRLIAFLTEDCCGGNPEICAGLTDGLAMTSPLTGGKEDTGMTDTTYNVLFLCTGNSARSILAESVLNRVGRSRFRAFSAGSHPAGAIHPYALDLLQRQNFPTQDLRSKNWNEFAQDGAPKLDFVFTVCDNAANEVCPVWPGQPMTAHWGLPDPAAVEGTEAERRLAFADALRMLTQRIDIFVNLPIESLDKLSLSQRLSEIGKSGAPATAEG